MRRSAPEDGSPRAWMSADGSGTPEAVSSLLSSYDRFELVWRRRFDLGPREKLVILQLARHSTATPSDLRAALGLTSAGVTNLLDRLQHKQYIHRQRHAVDGRRVLVSLSKRGLVAHLELHAVHIALARALEEAMAGAGVNVAVALGSVSKALDEQRLELEEQERLQGRGRPA